MGKRKRKRAFGSLELIRYIRRKIFGYVKDYLENVETQDKISGGGFSLSGIRPRFVQLGPALDKHCLKLICQILGFHFLKIYTIYQNSENWNLFKNIS